jgi:UDP-2,3-diacylglucosamine pyrophosphatase LpxH
MAAANIAIDNGYDVVVNGHIHLPVIKEIETENGNVTYMNSGDWVENMTALWNTITASGNSSITVI